MSLLPRNFVSPTSPRVMVALSTVAAAGFIAAILGLWLISQPHLGAQRLDVVQARLEDVQRMAGPSADPIHYPDNAICKDAELGPELGRSSLEAAAAGAGVMLSGVRIERMGGTPAPLLLALSAELAASGQEGQVKNFLQSLSNRAPLLLVDSVDLTSDATAVHLKFKGHFLCHDRRLP